MRLLDLRILCLFVTGLFSLGMSAQNVYFPMQETVYIHCGDSEAPAAIAALTGMTGPTVTTTTTYGTSDCATGTANQLTFTFTEQRYPRRLCMDELELIRRQWTATDECGFTLTRAQRIYIRDDVAPTLVCPAAITINAAMNGMASIEEADVITSLVDDCGMAVEVNIDQTNFTVCGTYPVVVTAEDGCHNISECAINVTVADSCPSSLPTNDRIQISLGYYCEAVMYPSLMLKTPVGECPLQMRIYDAYNVLVAKTDVTTAPYTYPTVDASFIGKDWKAEVFYEDCSGTIVSGWGWFTVEDKVKPSISCIDDFEVSCKEDLANLMTSTSTVRYCIDGPDLNPSATIETFALTSSGSVRPWEIITSVASTVPVSCSGASGGTGGGTGSGTGSGTATGSSVIASFDVGGYITIPCDAAGNYDFTALVGALGSDLSNNPTISFPTGFVPAGGLCFNITTESFGLYNPDNCDNLAEVVIVRDETDQNECGDAGYVAKRVIEYLIKDGSQTSSTCSFQINFVAEPLSEIVFPADYLANCADFVDRTPAVTGQPLLAGWPLDEDDFCKLNVSFEDTFIEGTETSIQTCLNFKVRRKWTVLDWCLGEYRQHFQEIKVVDNEAPVCSAAPDFSINTTVGCAANYIVTPYVEGSETEALFDDCSGVTIVRVEYTQTREAFSFNSTQGTVRTAVDLGDGTYRLSNLGVGQHWVRYILEDGCGNSNLTNDQACFFEITVEDNNPPIAVCDQYTAVSLADNGWGRLYGPSLDDGSYAPCGGDVSFQLRRASNPCEAALLDRDDTVFGDYAQFCCAEAGQTIPVELRVIDQAGHSSVCVVNVVVQDKNNDSVVTCPSSPVIVNNCVDIDPESRFGMPTLSGECAVPSIIDVRDSNTMNDDCGVGSFSRTWIIGVNGDANAVQNCTQTISITGSDGLSANSFSFPRDKTIDDCIDYESDLGDFPTYRGTKVTEANLCARLAYSYDDNPFFNVDGYCIKMIRTWTVINWCIYDPVTSPNTGIWTSTQIIKVRNTNGPELTNCAEDFEVSVDPDDCSAFVTLPMPDALDACFGETVPASDMAWTISGPGFSDQGVGNTASQTLSTGTYTISWTATGRCSATSNCSYQVNVKDDGVPIPYCIGIVTTVITAGGPNGQPTADIWASDFDLGSQDGCGGPLSVSFSPDDTNDRQRFFTCNQIGEQPINIWFTDSDGNQDFCISRIRIQVNGNICDTIGSRPINIEGDIYTEESQMIEAVPVELMTMSTNSMLTSSTDANGHYAFGNLQRDNDYRLQVQSADDYLNGISTLDLVIIQRHILGVEPIASPYKLIAADVNNSETINGADLVELRKLILGIYQELPENDSWRFINEQYTFDDPDFPWPFDENISLAQVGADMMDNDFIGVKIGDVNGSVEFSLTNSNVASRNANQLSVKHDALLLNDNKEYLVPVYFNENIELYGFQLSMDFAANVDLVSWEAGVLQIDEAETNLTDGRLDIAYARADLSEVAKDKALFYMTVKVEGDLPAEIFDIAHTGMTSELYQDGYEVYSLVDGQNKLVIEPILYQNVPNPFSGETLIEFDLPESSYVTMNIVDMNGKLVKSYNGYYEYGKHSIEVLTTDLSENGVYYYQMETENYTATRKMIRVD